MYICSMKPLRFKLLCLLFLAGSICEHARTVISQSTREPIVYASVGVINCNLGTVTDTSGHFSLKIPAEFINDSIRISSVGYVARTFAVRDIATIPDTISLADDVIMLREVVVKPRRDKASYGRPQGLQRIHLHRSRRRQGRGSGTGNSA